LATGCDHRKTRQLFPLHANFPPLYFSGEQGLGLIAEVKAAPVLSSFRAESTCEPTRMLQVGARTAVPDRSSNLHRLMRTSRLLMFHTGICGVIPVPTSQPRNLPAPYAASVASRSGFNHKACSVRSIIILVAATMRSASHFHRRACHMFRARRSMHDRGTSRRHRRRSRRGKATFWKFFADHEAYSSRRR
jgi:hypothetical protein